MLEFPFLIYVPLDTDLRFRELQEVLHAYEVNERIAHITPYRLVSMLWPYGDNFLSTHHSGNPSEDT